MELFNSDEVSIALTCNANSLIDNSFYRFTIDFDTLLRNFKDKYKYCNIELTSASQLVFNGDGPAYYFVISGLPWLNITNITNNMNSRIFGGNNQIIGLNSSRRVQYVGQIETFTLSNVCVENLIIELRQTSNNALVLQNVGLTFNFYPVYTEENYINEIYTNDNKQRRITII